MINIFDLEGERQREAVRRQDYVAEITWWRKAHACSFWGGQACLIAGLFCCIAESWASWLGCMAVACLMRIPYNYCHARVLSTMAAESARLAAACIAELDAMMSELADLEKESLDG